MRSSLLLALLVACHGSGPAPPTGSASGSAPSCAAKLDQLATFYEAVAADNAKVRPRPGLRQAELEAGVEALPEAPGAPADLSDDDLLLVGPTAVELVSISGEARRLDGGGMLDHVDSSTSGARTLVLEIDESMPWQRVEDVRAVLGKTDRPYPTVAVAYRTQGARAGRTPPQLPGAGSDRVDLPMLGDAIAKTAAAHCPDYAKQLAALQSGGTLNDPYLLRSLARTISHCDCGVDPALLEAMPWLAATPLVTTVPFTTTAPPLHGADSATWGDLVRDAKGPVPMAMPPSLPPPPPPPPPRRR
jgi:hypothetical protein